MEKAVRSFKEWPQRAWSESNLHGREKGAWYHLLYLDKYKGSRNKSHTKLCTERCWPSCWPELVVQSNISKWAPEKSASKAADPPTNYNRIGSGEAILNLFNNIKLCPSMGKLPISQKRSNNEADDSPQFVIKELFSGMRPKGRQMVSTYL